MTPPSQEFVSPDAATLGFSTERLKAIGSAYSRGVAAGEIPGAVVMIARDGKLVYSAAIGYRDIATGSVGDYHWAGSSGAYFSGDPREGLVAVVTTAAPLVRAAYRQKRGIWCIRQ